MTLLLLTVVPSVSHFWFVVFWDRPSYAHWLVAVGVSELSSGCRLPRCPPLCASPPALPHGLRVRAPRPSPDTASQMSSRKKKSGQVAAATGAAGSSASRTQSPARKAAKNGQQAEKETTNNWSADTHARAQARHRQTGREGGGGGCSNSPGSECRVRSRVT